MRTTIATAMIAALTMSACHKVDPSQGGEHKTETAREAKAVEGYGPLKLGMGFDEALAAMPSASWNPSSIKDCQNDLPIKGCFISQYGDVAIWRIDGIPFEPQLSFNKHAKLTDIGLVYEKESDIDRKQCLILYERTIDGLVSEYGRMAAAIAVDKPLNHSMTRTSGGNAYPTVSAGDKFFTDPIRSNLDGVKLPTHTPITAWNDSRYTSVFAFFMVVSGAPHCRITVNFAEPQSVERMVMEDALSKLAKELN